MTVIKTKYNYNGEEGTIALVGPKRMEYDRVIGVLDYLKNNMKWVGDLSWKKIKSITI